MSTFHNGWEYESCPICGHNPKINISNDKYTLTLTCYCESKEIVAPEDKGFFGYFRRKMHFGGSYSLNCWVEWMRLCDDRREEAIVSIGKHSCPKCLEEIQPTVERKSGTHSKYSYLLVVDCQDCNLDVKVGFDKFNGQDFQKMLDGLYVEMKKIISLKKSEEKIKQFRDRMKKKADVRKRRLTLTISSGVCNRDVNRRYSVERTDKKRR